VAIVFGVGLAALNTGNNLLYLVLAFMLSFLVLSGVLSEASLRGMRVERRLPRELFANTANRVALRIFNDHSRAPSFAVSIEDRIETEDAVRLAGRAFVLRVGAGKSVDRSYVFEPDRRGEIRFEGCRLSTRFPFGLFVKSVDLVLEAQPLVYPELLDPEVETRSARSLAAGEDRLRRSNHGDEVIGLREYVTGDPIQRVHWRRSLRARRLIVGERESESSAQVEVLLHLPATSTSTEIEHRVARATSDVVQFLDEGLEVGLRTDQVRFEADSGFTHRTALLSFLAHVMPTPSESDDPVRTQVAR